MLMFAVINCSKTSSKGGTTFPLSILVLICEVAFIVTELGAYVRTRRILSIGIKPAYIITTILCAFYLADLCFLV